MAFDMFKSKYQSNYTTIPSDENTEQLTTVAKTAQINNTVGPIFLLCKHFLC